MAPSVGDAQPSSQAVSSNVVSSTGSSAPRSSGGSNPVAVPTFSTGPTIPVAARPPLTTANPVSLSSSSPTNIVRLPTTRAVKAVTSPALRPPDTSRPSPGLAPLSQSNVSPHISNPPTAPPGSNSPSRPKPTAQPSLSEQAVRPGLDTGDVHGSSPATSVRLTHWSCSWSKRACVCTTWRVGIPRGTLPAAAANRPGSGPAGHSERGARNAEHLVNRRQFRYSHGFSSYSVRHANE